MFAGACKMNVMTWHLKNPVPPKAWGFGGKAPMWRTYAYIDCEFEISD